MFKINNMWELFFINIYIVGNIIGSYEIIFYDFIFCLLKIWENFFRLFIWGIEIIFVDLRYIL